jgi:hypothetical protein
MGLRMAGGNNEGVPVSFVRQPTVRLSITVGGAIVEEGQAAAGCRTAVSEMRYV